MVYIPHFTTRQEDKWKNTSYVILRQGWIYVYTVIYIFRGL